MTGRDIPKEKKWKHLYLRSQKLHRAKQLGIEYPRKSPLRIARESEINVVFVCSKNQWRSPTAEKVFGEVPFLNVRSRGTSRSARRQINERDIKWADLLIVMEQKHLQRLTGDYPGPMKYKKVHVLEITDDYKYMDRGLIDLLIESVVPILESADA